MYSHVKDNAYKECPHCPLKLPSRQTSAMSASGVAPRHLTADAVQQKAEWSGVSFFFFSGESWMIDPAKMMEIFYHLDEAVHRHNSVVRGQIFPPSLKWTVVPELGQVCQLRMCSETAFYLQWDPILLGMMLFLTFICLWGGPLQPTIGDRHWQQSTQGALTRLITCHLCYLRRSCSKHF